MLNSPIAFAVRAIIAFSCALLALCDTAFAAEAISNIDIFGRGMIDYTAAKGSHTSLSTDDWEIRRARIGTSALIFGSAKFKMELNIDSSDELTITDLYLDQPIAGKQLGLRIGHFKTPNSFDEANSSLFMSTQERSALTDVFDLDRRVGVALHGKHGPFDYIGGVYGQGIKDEDTFGGYSLAGRITWTASPLGEDTTTLIGGSVRYRALDEDQSDFRYRQKPVSHLAGRILATPRIGDSDTFLNADFVHIQGPFWAAAEYAVTFVDCPTCAGDPTFDGAYGEIGVMFGGRRKIKGGRFDRPTVFKTVREYGWGAASFVARFDTIDLTDAGIDGGGYNSWTLGADWWPTSHVRIGLNGFIVNADLGAFTSGVDPAIAAAIATGVSQETVRGVSFRGQFDF